jgi:hypothetical protein
MTEPSAPDPHTYQPDMIRANTVLPARREDVELHTADGLTLVGELALPLDRDPVATLVTLHPLPTHGGFMDSHVYRKASYRLPALADVAVLRFNLRGVTSPRGTSQGQFDEGNAERCDPAVEGAILLSPPLRFSAPPHLAQWAASGKPVLALVPELDDYLRPEQARERFAAIPQAEVIGVDGAKHLWVGEPAVRRVLNEIVARVNPAASPLPTSWDGPLGTPLHAG